MVLLGSAGGRAGSAGRSESPESAPSAGEGPALTDDDIPF